MLSTFEHRSYDLADIELAFTPQTDLAILNYIAHHIISTGRVNKDFVEKHTTFLLGNTDIGYGLRPEHPLQKAAKNAGDAGRLQADDVRRVRQVRRPPTTSTTRPSSAACPKSQLEALAELYADPKVKVMSFWTMGFNQHTRGVWCNNMVYNIHLLTGKIATPGNSPFSLTGQPSACGTAREVGTFSHRLPADMVVTNPKHRAHAEEIWKLPPGTIPDKPGYHAVLQNRMLKDGKLNAYWVMVNNNMQAAANLMQEGYPGYRNPTNFIVVSDVYPTVTALAPTSSCRRRCGSRRKAHTATPSAAPSSGTSWCGAGRGALRPVAADGVLQALQGRGGVAGGADREEARVPRQDAVRHAVSQRRGRQVPGLGRRGRLRQRRGQGLRLLRCRRACSRSTRSFGRGHGHDLAPFDTYHQVRGLRWPVVNGKETLWRYREGCDPYVKAGTGFQFYGYPDGKARDLRPALRAGGRSRRTRSSRSGCRPVACSSTGIRAR